MQERGITITIRTDNAAFEDDAAGEVARILRDLAQVFEQRRDGFPLPRGLYDLNGNTVGKAVGVVNPD